MKILIVDDSRLICERLEAMISALPMVEAVRICNNAQEAISATGSWAPDLVILDLRMAGGDGFQYLENAGAFGAARPRVVVLTNYANEQYRRRCLDLGATAFLDKSHQVDELPRLIAHFSHSQRLSAAAGFRGHGGD